MMAEDAGDDPFERAARRERRDALKAAGGGHGYGGYGGYEDYSMVPGMIGTAAAWAVVLWLHAYLGDTDSRLFRIHFVVFVLFAAIAVGGVVYALAKRLLFPRKRDKG